MRISARVRHKQNKPKKRKREMITREIAEWLVKYVNKHPIAKVACCARCTATPSLEVSAEKGYGSARFVCKRCGNRASESAICEDAASIADDAKKIWNAEQRKLLRQIIKEMKRKG
jgi:hypothetical protein